MLHLLVRILGRTVAKSTVAVLSLEIVPPSGVQWHRLLKVFRFKQLLPGCIGFCIGNDGYSGSEGGVAIA